MLYDVRYLILGIRLLRRTRHPDREVLTILGFVMYNTADRGAIKRSWTMACGAARQAVGSQPLHQSVQTWFLHQCASSQLQTFVHEQHAELIPEVTL